MSQVSPPGAVRLSAPWNEAEAHEWTLPCSSLVHSFSLPKSLRRLPPCARQGSSALGRAGPAGGSRLSQVRGRWRLSPVPRRLLLLTGELHALRGPW